MGTTSQSRARSAERQEAAYRALRTDLKLWSRASDPGGRRCILRLILHETMGPYHEYVSRNSRLVSKQFLRPNCGSEPDIRDIGLPQQDWIDGELQGSLESQTSVCHVLALLCSLAM